MPIPALVLLFVLVPIAELYVIYKVGDAIGVRVDAGDPGGRLAARLAAAAIPGQGGLEAFQRRAQTGRMPHREVQHGVAVIFGGALLLTPGFLTDILGLALLLPPTRAVIVRLAQRTAAKRMARAAGERARRPQRGYDVEGTASEHPPPPASPRRLDR